MRPEFDDVLELLRERPGEVDAEAVARIRARLQLAHPEVAELAGDGAELADGEAVCPLCGRPAFVLEGDVLGPHDRGTLPVEVCDGAGRTPREALALSAARTGSGLPPENDNSGDAECDVW